MAIKSRNKINAQFSTASMSDLVFLLLIFFMLTSSMVQINVPLPQSDSKTVAPSDFSVMIKKDETVSFNGKETTFDELEKVIATNLRYSENKENAVLSIISESGVTYDKLHEIMKIAAGLKMKAILATQPKE